MGFVGSVRIVERLQVVRDMDKVVVCHQCGKEFWGSSRRRTCDECKEENKKKRYRRYYQNHAEELRQKARDNPNRAANTARYKKRHPDRVKENDKRQYDKNKEKCLERSRKYRETHKEYFRDKAREYRAKYPEKYKLYNQRNYWKNKKKGRKLTLRKCQRENDCFNCPFVDCLF